MSPARGCPVAFSALLAAAKMGVEIPSIHLVFPHVLVYALVAYADSFVPGKPAAYLLGAPVFSEQQLHANPGLFGDTVCAAIAPAVRKPLGLLGTVTSFAAVAVKFPAYGGFVYFQVFRGPGLVVPRFAQDVNLVSLFQGVVSKIAFINVQPVSEL